MLGKPEPQILRNDVKSQAESHTVTPGMYETETKGSLGLAHHRPRFGFSEGPSVQGLTWE